MLLCHCLLPCHYFRYLSGEIILEENLRALVKESKCEKNHGDNELKLQLENNMYIDVAS